MSFKTQFNINHTFVKEEDIILLKAEGKIDTYRFKQPIEHPLHKGFFVIPDFNDYLLNKQGELFCISKAACINYIVTKPDPKLNSTGGYRTSYIWCAYGTKRFVSRHRLLCIVFKDYDFHPSLRWVNHIDGVPGNDTIDNLEWVTPGQNVQHAYDNGLHSNKTVAVTLGNWKTGFEKDYDSLAVACRELNLLYATMATRLYRENTEVKFEDGWRIKLKSDLWVPMNNHRVQPNMVEVYVRDVRNNRVFTYHSINEASIQTKVDHSVVQSHCGRLVKNPVNYFNFRYVNGFTSWPEYTKDQLELIKMNGGNQGPCGVIAYDKTSNERKWFKLLDDAALEIGISPITLRKLATAEGIRKDLKFEQVIIA